MEINTLLTALGLSLGLTLILEVGFFFILFYIAGNFFFSAPWNKKDILLVILVNTLTNPVVVLIYRILYFNSNINTVMIILPLEVFAVLTEGFIYKKSACCIKRPFLFSLMANTFSYIMGLMIQRFF